MERWERVFFLSFVGEEEEEGRTTRRFKDCWKLELIYIYNQRERMKIETNGRKQKNSRHNRNKQQTDTK